MCASFCVIHVHKQKGRRRCIYNSVGDLFSCAVGPYCFAGCVFSVLLFFFASSG